MQFFFLLFFVSLIPIAIGMSKGFLFSLRGLLFFRGPKEKLPVEVLNEEPVGAVGIPAFAGTQRNELPASLHPQCLLGQMPFALAQSTAQALPSAAVSTRTTHPAPPPFRCLPPADFFSDFSQHTGHMICDFLGQKEQHG